MKDGLPDRPSVLYKKKKPRTLKNILAPSKIKEVGNRNKKKNFLTKKATSSVGRLTVVLVVSLITGRKR